jgi:16S rRNA (cytosine967-C5)-methyltransferase
MRPAARLQAAIELLDEIIIAARDNGASADALATGFFKARRYAGSKDRRFIRNLTWTAIRRFGERPETARSAFVAMADEDGELAALFDGSGYGPALIGKDELRAAGDVIPGWIGSYLSHHINAEERTALLERAPLDLRANSTKTTRQALLIELPEAEVLAALPNALRLPTGFAIEKHAVMLDGRAEIQDYGSQLIVAACKAQPEMTVLDLCAGAGGKTLALYADMLGKAGLNGRLIASDTNRARLGQLTPRAQRAGAHDIEALLLNPGQESAMLSEFTSKCDVVLVDAPCSGSGTWRRNPETRWRLTSDRLEKVMEQQARLLEIASEMVAPGGHLVYAVCSLLNGEGAQQVAKFLSNNSGWRTVFVGIDAGRADGDGILLTPRHDGTDGFFLARLEKL